MIKDFFRNRKLLLTAIGLLLLIGILTVLLLPPVLSLKEEENRAAFAAFVESLGFRGVLLLLAIQILQIIVAVIPGEPFEILAGMMYGTVGGLCLCLTGVLIATVAVYFTVRKLGRDWIEKLYAKEEQSKYAFLFESDNITYLIFLLFLIPGTPKDILTYLCPFTKIKPGRYFLLSTFARIPSIVTSTLVGATLSEGKLHTSLLLFLGTALLGLAGITVHNRFFGKNRKN